jgi:hypothetical protein
MKVDTLYLFKWDKKGDTSNFIKEYEAKDFLMIEPMAPDGMKTKYNIRIEMRDIVEFIGTQFCIEIQSWINSLKCAKRCGEENEKSKKKAIGRNIDFLVGLYRRKRGEDINKFIEVEVEKYIDSVDIKKMEPPMFLERIQKIFDH